MLRTAGMTPIPRRPGRWVFVAFRLTWCVVNERLVLPNAKLTVFRHSYMPRFDILYLSRYLLLFEACLARVGSACTYRLSD